MSTKNIQVKIQKMGAFLSNMIMPNIGAFIAWGFITALFIPTGWYPNAYFGELVTPTIKYLLPMLIAYTGGANVYGRRGGVIGALATMGVVVGANITMLVGAMVMGPLSAWIMKKVDKLYEGKIKPGLEMLVDNFSLGIVGGILMLLGYSVVEPIFSVVLSFLSSGVNFALAHGLIPFASIFVSPAQAIFLNNAVNHGILVPLGIQQVVEQGRSILFLVESNGGPLVGVMLGYCLFGKGVAKKTAPAATFIVMFGGIAEVYMPYILMKPKLIIATILGSMSSLFFLQIFHGGLVAAPSPGSIFAVVMMSPKGVILINVAAYFIGMVVAAVVASLMLRFESDKVNESDMNSEQSVEKPELSNTLSDSSGQVKDSFDSTDVISDRKIFKIIVACDAGMGSSAMGASVLRNRAKKLFVDVDVKNASVQNLPDDADLVITHVELMKRAKSNLSNKHTQFMSIVNFIEAKQYDRILDHVKSNNREGVS